MQQFIPTMGEGFFMRKILCHENSLRKTSHLILLGRNSRSIKYYSYPMSYSNRFIFPFAGNEPSSVDNIRYRRRWKWFYIIDVTSWHMSIYRTNLLLLLHSHKMPFFGLYSLCFISDNPLHAADINELWRCRLVWSLIFSEVKKKNKDKKRVKKEQQKKKTQKNIWLFKQIQSYQIYIFHIFLWNCFTIA